MKKKDYIQLSYPFHVSSSSSNYPIARLPSIIIPSSSAISFRSMPSLPSSSYSSSTSTSSYFPPSVRLFFVSGSPDSSTILSPFLWTFSSVRRQVWPFLSATRTLSSSFEPLLVVAQRCLPQRLIPLHAHMSDPF